MAVQYQRGNYALQTLVAERIAKWGKPDRYSEYVTGYGAGGITGHNADINGVVHAVDIFVGPGNLTQAQGIELAEFLRDEGKRGKIPGHPDRLAYIIHRGQIAGDHTNWEWIPYTGADWHGDHIHISSVFDYYWGDPVAGHPLDYDNTSSWGLAKLSTTKPQGTKPTPIQEDDMPLTTADINKLLDHPIARKGGQTGNTTLRNTAAFLDANLLNIPAGVWAETVLRGGRNVSVKQELADAKTLAEKNAAENVALRTVLAQIAAGGTIDLKAIEAAVKSAVSKAITDGVALDATVTIKADQ